MFCKGVTAEAWLIMRKSWLSRSSDYLCFCVSAASAVHQLVWEHLVCPFICLMKHSKTVSAAGIRVCLSLGKSASNSGREVEIQTQECQVCFLPKDHQGSMKIRWDWKKKKTMGNLELHQCLSMTCSRRGRTAYKTVPWEKAEVTLLTPQ